MERYKVNKLNWKNILVSPSVKQALLIFKARRNCHTVDEVLRLLLIKEMVEIENETKESPMPDM